MKGSVRIISGRFRGKEIPFKNSSFDNADITPQKVKGALFSILGENLAGKVFIDLFSGSGQIGFEAVSRGAEMVVLNESDYRRYNFISGFTANLGAEVSHLVFNMKAEDVLPFIKLRGVAADIIFLDPPYEKVKGEVPYYEKILSKIAETEILNPGGVVAVQHFSLNLLDEYYCGFKRLTLKKYGTTSISIYEM